MPTNRPPFRRWGLIFILPLIWVILHLLLRPKPAANPKMVAHRGAAGLAPENTLAAIQRGLMHNADAVEIDVRRSRDGVLLLMHDSTVERTTNGAGAVAALPWADIQRLDAGSHFSGRYSAERVPSLAEALEAIQADSGTLLIEVKEPDLYPGLGDDLAEAIRQAQAQDQVVVISFDRAWIADFYASAPDIPIGMLAYGPLLRPPLLAAKIVIVFWPAVFLDPTFVPRMHTAGHLVYVYTVNDSRLMQQLLARGVDGIITDCPDLWAQVEK